MTFLFVLLFIDHCGSFLLSSTGEREKRENMWIRGKWKKDQHEGRMEQQKQKYAPFPHLLQAQEAFANRKPICSMPRWRKINDTFASPSHPICNQYWEMRKKSIRFEREIEAIVSCRRFMLNIIPSAFIIPLSKIRAYAPHSLWFKWS